jgi:hypothetical protein
MVELIDDFMLSIRRRQASQMKSIPVKRTK